MFSLHYYTAPTGILYWTPESFDLMAIFSNLDNVVCAPECGWESSEVIECLEEDTGRPFSGVWGWISVRLTDIDVNPIAKPLVSIITLVLCLAKIQR